MNSRNACQPMNSRQACVAVRTVTRCPALRRLDTLIHGLDVEIRRIMARARGGAVVVRPAGDTMCASQTVVNEDAVLLSAVNERIALSFKRDDMLHDERLTISAIAAGTHYLQR